MPLFDSKGSVVALGTELGRGGEGSVFAVSTSSHSGLVAKIYHKPIDGEKSAKLATMARLSTDRLTRLAAWPVETLHASPRGTITGLLMPKVSGKEVHLLYSPKSRQTHFPSANWPFLIHTAANVARAVAVIHEHGHVIGDINHGNLFVSDQATVMLIDCDSFQVSAQGHSYLCEVGVDTYTPPELQGKPLKDVLRTASHDHFGLAVLIFHLLFMGRHPFAGRYLGPEAQPPLERLIASYRFAYGPQAASRQMQTPPGTLPFVASGNTIGSLFERAFASPVARLGLRPLAQEWVTALSSLAKQIKVCSQNASHHYLQSLPACPWCVVESKSGVALFGLMAAGGARAAAGATFNLTVVWAHIISVAPPAPPQPLPNPDHLPTTPSPKVLEANRTRWSDVAKVTGIFSGMKNWLNRQKQRAAAKKQFDEETATYKRHLEDQRAAWQMACRAWNDAVSTSDFDRCLAQLELTKQKHEALTARRVKQLQDLQKNARERQLVKHLEYHELRHAQLQGIGQSRKATLQSYGIETAADISANAIMSVPGFGPAMAGTLLAWRRTVEAGFVFNSAKAVSPADIKAIENAIAAQQQPLEKELLNGKAQLEKVKTAIIERRQALRPRVEEAAQALAQAEADLQALRFEAVRP